MAMTTIKEAAMPTTFQKRAVRRRLASLVESSEGDSAVGLTSGVEAELLFFFFILIRKGSDAMHHDGAGAGCEQWPQALVCPTAKK